MGQLLIEHFHGAAMRVGLSDSAFPHRSEGYNCLILTEAAIARNDGKAFGACHACKHFRKNSNGTAQSPHRCALLDEPLSDADSTAICAEQEI